MDETAGVSLEYLGWSGFRFAGPGGGPIFLDPPLGATIGGEGGISILLSHGHPEHVAGCRSFLERGGDGPPTTVVASPSVCRYLTKRTRRANVTFRPVLPDDQVTLGVRQAVEVFRWRHLPLLPPGASAALRHMAGLASRPRLAARIVLAGLAGPGAGDMLGFRLRLGEPLIVAYGEGLHRRCPSADAAAQCQGSPRTLLLVAVEPEDEGVLPDLIHATSVGRAVLFEPHAEWRDAFGMRRADLPTLKQALEARDICAIIAEPEVCLQTGH